jgi:hypothetical protein
MKRANFNVAVAIQSQYNPRPPMVKMTFLNADVYPPVPETVDVPDHLVESLRDVVYICDDPSDYIEPYPYDWIDYDDNV